ncbi:DUF2690 domain-containing protein [Phytohabitans suffuscus]|nr:DUF2690 domain-containing protein [Phytohabitans suffuscus]
MLSCNGREPTSYGCDADAVTLVEVDYWGTVALRYSRACHAAWARWTNHSPSGVVATVRIEGSANTYETHTAGYGYEVKWTRMVSFSQYVRACLLKKAPTGDIYKECTPYR